MPGFVPSPTVRPPSPEITPIAISVDGAISYYESLALPWERAAFIRAAAVTVFHSTGTAKMGRDGTAVVDGHLKVHGMERLRIADASIMPRITTGNTMAPCVIIGERAGDILTARWPSPS